MSSPPRGFREELGRAIASGRLTVILVVVFLIAGLVAGISVNRQGVRQADDRAAAAERRADLIKQAVDDELARRARQRDAKECALLDSFIPGPLLPEQRRRLTDLRMAIPAVNCPEPIPAPQQ